MSQWQTFRWLHRPIEVIWKHVHNCLLCVCINLYLVSFALLSCDTIGIWITDQILSANDDVCTVSMPFLKTKTTIRFPGNSRLTRSTCLQNNGTFVLDTDHCMACFVHVCLPDHTIVFVNIHDPGMFDWKILQAIASVQTNHDTAFILFILDSSFVLEQH